jgi:hypothetical protein
MWAFSTGAPLSTRQQSPGCRSRSAGGALLVGLLCAAAAPAGDAHAAGAALDPAPALAGALPARLSDELTLTRWTTAVTRSAIRRRRTAASPTVARLRYYTEDRQPEIYVGLERARGRDGRWWVRVRVPMRPNGVTGWVPRAALGAWHATRHLLHVNRRTRRATLYRAGHPVWSSPVGLGRAETPTPVGRFYVRERIANLAGDPVYGPIAFGTSAYSRLSEWPGGGVIGIHGTDQPQLIPGRVSHGCVRIPNPAIVRLARRLRVGTPVRITDAPLDALSQVSS